VKTTADSIDAALDAALDMTFPASDPIAVFMPDSSWHPVAQDGKERRSATGPMTTSLRTETMLFRTNHLSETIGRDTMSAYRKTR